jgi:DNA (cytosine-5)-methyltransferase 1
MIIANTPSPFVSESNIYDVNGISPTLMARDYKGPKLIAIKNATKKGYLIAKDGDGIDTAYPESKTIQTRYAGNR